MTAHNPESLPVYIVSGGKIKQGTVLRVDEPRVSVGLDGSAIHTVHKSEVFTPQDVVGAGLDLLDPIQPGDEKRLNKVAQELVTDPGIAEEMAIRLGSEAVARYVGAERSPRDLGVRSVEELIGDAADRGSNRWKIKDLLDGVASGVYGEGSRNDLQVARMTADVKGLPAMRQAEIRSEIARVNRLALDTLHDENGVDYGQGAVYVKARDGYQEVVTVYPVEDGSMSFVETAYYPGAESRTDLADAEYFNAAITVGFPQFSQEDGYSRTV